MKNFIVYRNGTKDNLAQHVKAAVAHFYQTVGALPLGIVVSPQRKDDAAKVLTALDLASVPVGASGGCLLAELWLEAPMSFDISAVRGVQ